MKQNKIIFKLNTQKIIYISILLAIYVILSLFAKLIPPIFLGFLKIEFTDFIFLFALDIINWFYSLILIIISTWSRFLYLPEDPVGLTALMISNIVMLILFIFFRYLLTILILLFKTFKNKSAKVKALSINIISVFLTTILTALAMILFNYLFILEWYVYYYKMPLKQVNEYKSYLASIFLPFNLIKFSINSFLYIIIFPLTWELKKTIYP